MSKCRDIKPGDFVRHFKGNLYVVKYFAQHTETNETMVVYLSVLNPDKVYTRPLEMFMSEVDKTKYPNATQKYRFELCNRKENKV